MRTVTEEIERKFAAACANAQGVWFLKEVMPEINPQQASQLIRRVIAGGWVAHHSITALKVRRYTTLDRQALREVAEGRRMMPARKNTCGYSEPITASDCTLPLAELLGYPVRFPQFNGAKL